MLSRLADESMWMARPLPEGLAPDEQASAADHQLLTVLKAMRELAHKAGEAGEHLAAIGIFKTMMHKIPADRTLELFPLVLTELTTLA